MVIIFDLDDTLVIEEPSAVETFYDLARIVYARYQIDKDTFVTTAREKTREIWQGLPVYNLARQIGISSWEALWANFEGNDHRIIAIKQYKDYYQHHAWKNVLMKFNIFSDELVELLSQTFHEQRRKKHFLFPETISVLNRLKSAGDLYLLTNGTPDLQWEKINGTGIKDYFKEIIISGECGYRKPSQEIFRLILEKYRDNPKQNFLMVGNSLRSDIQGANNCGITSVWVNREHLKNDSGHEPDYEIDNLEEISDILSVIGSAMNKNNKYDRKAPI